MTNIQIQIQRKPLELENKANVEVAKIAGGAAWGWLQKKSVPTDSPES